MEFTEKARIRLEHWITHNDHHVEEYETFAGQLEQEGKTDSARHVREMMGLLTKSTECLRRAVEGLD